MTSRLSFGAAYPNRAITPNYEFGGGQELEFLRARHNFFVLRRISGVG